MFLETILADALRGDDEERKPPSPIAGRWRNRRGSEMELTVENHEIRGSFHAEVGAVDPRMSFHVLGFLEGEAVSFCVDFGRRGSVASWSGHHVNDEQGDRIVSLWHLARPVPDTGRSDLYNAMLAGADEFFRVTD